MQVLWSKDGNSEESERSGSYDCWQHLRSCCSGVPPDIFSQEGAVSDGAIGLEPR